MAKKERVQKPERFYAGGFYMTKVDDHTFSVPPGLGDHFKQWNEKHLGLQRMLQELAAYVAEQRGALYREQNQFWDKITDGLNLPRGSNATLHFEENTIKIVPFSQDRLAILKVEIVDRP